MTVGYNPNPSALNRSHPLAKGLVGAWIPGLGPTGQTLRDVSGWHHHGSLVGNPTWTPSVNGYVLDFGGSQYVDTGVEQVGSTGLFADSSQKFTVLASTRGSSDGTVVARAGNSSGSRTFQLLKSSGQFSVYLRGTNNASLGATSASQYDEVAVKWDGATASFFVNGVKASLSVGSASEESGQRIIFGARTNGTGFRLTGQIGEVLISNQAWADGEIQKYQRSRGYKSLLNHQSRRVYSIPQAGGGATVEIGLASGTETALPLQSSKIVQIGLVTETSSAFALASHKTIEIGLTSETDSAFSTASSKLHSIGLSTEIDSVLSPTTAKTVEIGITQETSNSLPLGTAAKIKEIGLTVETSQSLNAAPTSPGKIGLATETSSTFELTPEKSKELGLAFEASLVQVIGANKNKLIGIASENGSALELSSSKNRLIGLTTETNTAFGIPISIENEIGITVETDSAIAFAFLVPIVGGKFVAGQEYQPGFKAGQEYQPGFKAGQEL